jgi:hypothetical protein
MIIGISGWAGSGKDTVTDFMGFPKASFGQTIKDALFALNPTIDGKSLQELVIAEGWDTVKRRSEVRGLLQRFGTEVGREMFGENFWVDITLHRLPLGITVVPDVRFKNEAETIRKKGGILWRVSRAGVTAPNDHVSEHDLDDYPFDTIIYNNGSIDELYEIIKKELGKILNTESLKWS